jgi:hypothetical protein
MDILFKTLNEGGPPPFEVQLPERGNDPWVPIRPCTQGERDERVALPNHELCPTEKVALT